MMHDERADGLDEGRRLPRHERTAASRGLGQQARKRIGTHLRAMYESVIQQPVPSRFTDLIARLDDAPAPLTRSDP